MYWPLLPLCAGVFLAAADQTVIVTVLPDMLFDLRVPVSDLDRASWTVTGYLIGYVAAMPLMGRIADRYGYHPAFVGAMFLFALGSVLVALAASLPDSFGAEELRLKWVVGARVLQAVGGGAALPVALAAAAALRELPRQAIAFGVVGASAEAGGVVGPLWGGVVGQAASWEWVFWLNVPIVGVLVTVPAIGLLRRFSRGQSPAPAGGVSGRPRAPRIDYPGAALVAAALALVTWGLSTVGKPDVQTGLLFVLAALAGAALIWRQRRAADPILPRPMLASPRFGWANLCHALIGSALIIGMVTVPLMANTVLETSALEGGLRLLRMTLAIAAGALLGGILTARVGPRPPALIGLAAISAGMFLMSGWDLEIVDPPMTVHLAIAGLGFGLLIAPVFRAGMAEIEGNMRATASSWLTVARMIGMTIGLAAMTAWGATRFDTLVAGIPALSLDPTVQAETDRLVTEAGLTVFQGFFRAGAMIALAAIVPAWLMTRQPRPATGQRPVTEGPGQR
ncbi:MAG: MFS transporter [Chloroflexi bacterium]|nr:MFS transporter [Chloroflexota bacterium]